MLKKKSISINKKADEYITVQDLNDYNKKIINLIDSLFTKNNIIQRGIIKQLEFVFYPVVLAIAVGIFVIVFLISSYLLTLYKSADVNSKLLFVGTVLVPLATFYIGRKTKKSN